MSGNKSYLHMHVYFDDVNVKPSYLMPLLWCHCYDRPLIYGKSKCFDTHTNTVETLMRRFSLRSTVSTCNEWMESNTKEMYFYPPRTECINLGVNTMTLMGRICDTFKTSWSVYHNSSDHNCSVFHWGGIVGELLIHYINKAFKLVPVSDLQRENVHVIIQQQIVFTAPMVNCAN